MDGMLSPSEKLQLCAMDSDQISQGIAKLVKCVIDCKLEERSEGKDGTQYLPFPPEALDEVDME
jgi:hypothetical protein